MPLYSFFSESKNEYRDVFFHMNDEKNYCGEDGTEAGEWRRIYTVPTASIDTRIDPNNRNEFIRRTDKYKSVGDLLDKSKELSEQRKAKDGRDSVQEKFFANYEKITNGKKHPSALPKKYEDSKISVDL